MPGLDDALIAKFLAQEAQAAGAVNVPSAPRHLTMGLREAYAHVEAELSDCPVSLKATALTCGKCKGAGVLGRNQCNGCAGDGKTGKFPRSLLTRAHQGLLVVAKGSIEAQDWRTVPDAILAQHRPLLGELRTQQASLAPKQGAAILQQLAQADIDEAAANA